MDPKPLPDNDRYLVYPDGRIYDRCPPRGIPRFLPQSPSGDYLTVSIRKNGWVRTYWVHKTVAEVFIPKIPGKNMARHLNGNPRDNNVENLAWGNNYDNMQDRKRHGRYIGIRGEENHFSKLTNEDVIDIRVIHKFGASQSSLATAFGVNQQTISKICLGLRWAHIKQGL